MPYNTRRKSLSLPSLGIQLPNTSRSHRSLSASKAQIAAASENQPPPKKVKRSHDSESQSAASSSLEEQIHVRKTGARVAGAYGQTPPPSPADLGIVAKIDTEGISDDIIVAVIEQLEKTGNRPHLIKELATVLSATNETIAKFVADSSLPPTPPTLSFTNKPYSSANAAALISSRLSLYLKRPWSALAPCPIAKEHIQVHPRKVFFYLTNSPAQGLPEDSSDIISTLAGVKHLTPSPSNASVDLDDEGDYPERSRMSPSPEVDLSTPAFEQDDPVLIEDCAPGRPPTPTGSYSVRNRIAQTYSLSHSSRAVSPPLEGDEKEFTMTASAVRERTSSVEEAVTKQAGHQNLDPCQEGGDEVRVEATIEDCFASHEEHSQSHDYDYFSSHMIRSEASADVDSSNAEILGIPPSPSESSDLCLSSSASSTASDVEIDDLAITSPIDGASTSTGVPGTTITSCKRSLDMLSTGFDFHLDAGLDSWLDLQSPEAIDIQELDAIFADV
ncbi:hypothetical protein LOZ66_003728 [Ophidiomyces ophidiicola]|nr:hypothetical protein LOZ66_003728 [Ophidiomyces ophidiicola]